MKHLLFLAVFFMFFSVSKSIAQEKRVVFFKTFLAPQAERASAPTDTLAGVGYDKNNKSYTFLFAYNKKESKLYSCSVSTGTEQNQGVQPNAMPAGTFYKRVIGCIRSGGSADDRLHCIMEAIHDAIVDCFTTDCFW